MILVVPISPEVPKRLQPRFWTGAVLAALLAFGFINTHSILESDMDFVQTVSEEYGDTDPANIPEKLEAQLKQRPLLKIAPARGDWNLYRLLLANFIHGSKSHLLLNVLCAFTGARICATFFPLATILAIFTMAGTIGLFLSMFLSESQSLFIPHIGASAGIFGLMGAYYVYNFAFRTRYFFWFPTRNRYFLSLPTASFFFVDVILVELVLSTAQFLPNRWDNVDHFAHVFGFLSGMMVAFAFRTSQRWPGFIQTRAEYFLFKLLHRRSEALSMGDYFNLLELNSFNDPLKCRIIESLANKTAAFSSPEEWAAFFRFITPTFMRYHLPATLTLLKLALDNGTVIPRRWLQRLPYDLLIQIAYHMSETRPQRLTLLRLFCDFISANHDRPQITRRVERLVEQLEAETESTGILKSN